jgi:hypothetical protein
MDMSVKGESGNSPMKSACKRYSRTTAKELMGVFTMVIDSRR